MTILMAVRKGLQQQQNNTAKKLQQFLVAGTPKVSYSGPAVDYDHFSHGWAVGDLGDFTGKGKYHMQTFNKISPKVRSQVEQRRKYYLCILKIGQLTQDIIIVIYVLSTANT